MTNLGYAIPLFSGDSNPLLPLATAGMKPGPWSGVAAAALVLASVPEIVVFILWARELMTALKGGLRAVGGEDVKVQ